MSNWIFKRGSKKRQLKPLTVDSWLDSSVYGAWAFVVDLWRSYSSFFSRFHLSGVRRLISNLLSEGLNLGVAGLLLMLGLALPSFKLTVPCSEIIC